MTSKDKESGSLTGVDLERFNRSVASLRESYGQPASSPRQRRQQALAWKLRMLMGARGSCAERWHERDALPPEVKDALWKLGLHIDQVTTLVRIALKEIK